MYYFLTQCQVYISQIMLLLVIDDKVLEDFHMHDFA